jgi:hypothetical protein
MILFIAGTEFLRESVGRRLIVKKVLEFTLHLATRFLRPTSPLDFRCNKISRLKKYGQSDQLPPDSGCSLQKGKQGAHSQSKRRCGYHVLDPGFDRAVTASWIAFPGWIQVLQSEKSGFVRSAGECATDSGR